jgi:hypothetical protein
LALGNVALYVSVGAQREQILSDTENSLVVAAGSRQWLNSPSLICDVRHDGDLVAAANYGEHGSVGRNAGHGERIRKRHGLY